MPSSFVVYTMKEVAEGCPAMIGPHRERCTLEPQYCELYGGDDREFENSAPWRVEAAGLRPDLRVLDMLR